MFQRLFHTDNDYTLAVLRVILGIVFFAHGAQKALGWFGGPGFNGTINFFQQAGIPAPLAVLDRRRVLGRAGPAGGSSRTGGCFGNHHQYGCGHLDGPQPSGFLHELVRQPKRRGI